MRYGLTHRENDCLNFIEFYIQGSEGQIGPTFRELQIAMGLKSKSTIFPILNSLEEKGWITRLPSKARSIRLIDKEPCRHCGKLE